MTCHLEERADDLLKQIRLITAMDKPSVAKMNDIEAIIEVYIVNRAKLKDI